MMLFILGDDIYFPERIVSNVGTEGTLHNSMRFEAGTDEEDGSMWFALTSSDEAYMSKRSVSCYTDTPSDYNHYGVQGMVLFQSGVMEALTLSLRSAKTPEEAKSNKGRRYQMDIGHRPLPMYSGTRDIICLGSTLALSGYFYGLVQSGTKPIEAYYRTIYRFGYPEIELVKVSINDCLDFMRDKESRLIGTIYGTDGEAKERSVWRRANN